MSAPVFNRRIYDAMGLVGKVQSRYIFFCLGHFYSTAMEKVVNIPTMQVIYFLNFGDV